MHKDNSSAEFYKQKAIEEARRNLQPKIVDTKEIYRTNGYLSRENSPQTEKEKGYNANYKNIKRLSSPTTYDNSSRTLQSSAVRDTTDYSKVHGLNYSTGDFRVQPELSPKTKRWINETQEQANSAKVADARATPFDDSYRSQSPKSNRNYMNSSRSSSSSHSRCTKKPRFEIIDDEEEQIQPQKSHVRTPSMEQRKKPSYVVTETNSRKSPLRQQLQNRRYDDYSDY